MKEFIVSGEIKHAYFHVSILGVFKLSLYPCSQNQVKSMEDYISSILSTALVLALLPYIPSIIARSRGKYIVLPP